MPAAASLTWAMIPNKAGLQSTNGSVSLLASCAITEKEDSIYYSMSKILLLLQTIQHVRHHFNQQEKVNGRYCSIYMNQNSPDLLKDGQSI